MNPLRTLADYSTLRWRFRRLTAEGIRCHQWREVGKLLRLARSRSPFYRDLYAGRDVRSLQEFAGLPTIDKRTMMEHFDTLNTAGLKLDALMEYALRKELARDYLGYYEEEYVVGLSSGTSGARGIYVTPRALTQRLPGVFLARSGIPLRLLPFRILFLLRVFSQGFDDIRSPLVSLTYMSTMTCIGEIVERMNDERTNILMAPPSLLRTLAPSASAIREKPRLIVSYAEVLEGEAKRKLEAAFGCPVVEIYQASEGQIGSACQHGTLHINEDLVYVELLDETGTPVDRPGTVARKILVTNLVNTVQPIIRYEMNDLIELGTPCRCGSKFRTIAKVLGRQDDVFEFRTEDGTPRPVFPDVISRWIITASDAIREFRATQNAEGDVDLLVEPEAQADADAVRQAVEARLRSELAALGIRNAVRVRCGAVPLPPDHAKLRRFVRERPQEEA
jgi:putative adenylate-forming enzyme